MPTKPIVIFGTGDFARTAFLYLTEEGGLEVAGFTVHERYLVEPHGLDREVVAFERAVEAFPPEQFSMLVAVGFSKLNEARASAYDKAKAAGYELASYVSSRASVMSDLSIGDNCFIFENNVIQPNVRIGSNVVLWSGNHIGHDVTIEDHVFVASHAVVSGNVTIGHHSFVGVNATFRDGITVAPKCVIGAGALIMKDTVEGGVYAVRGTQPIARKSWEIDL
jgi:sugar O-acyltransferase (sialic acid O-acetyltransferase NeuD family)